MALKKGKVDKAAWLSTLEVNTVAPLKLTEALLPNILQSNLKKIAVITSMMGSITDNTSGGSYIYRSSKAALNAAFRSLAIDLRGDGIAIGILHPGWVKTDMGGSNAILSTEESVKGLIEVIGALNLKTSGQFTNYNGKAIPW